MTPHPQRRKLAWQHEPSNVSRSVAISCSAELLPQWRDFDTALPRTDYMSTDVCPFKPRQRDYACMLVSSSWVMDLVLTTRNKSQAWGESIEGRPRDKEPPPCCHPTPSKKPNHIFMCSDLLLLYPNAILVLKS